MEGFHMVRDLVRQGDWLAKIDLKDTYFLILVHPCHQKFLQFTWKESLHQFQCLPFGLLRMCPPSVYKSDETSSGLSQREGNQINNLFGRPIDYLQLSRDPVSSNQLNPVSEKNCPPGRCVRGDTFSLETLSYRTEYTVRSRIMCPGLVE